MEATEGLGLQIEPDDYGIDGQWGRFSASSGDYFQYGKEDDLSGRLVARRSIYLDVEDLDLWAEFVAAVNNRERDQ